MWSGVRRADIGEKEKAEKSVSTSSSVVTSPLKWPACSLAIDTGITARLTMSPHQPNPSGPLTLSVERNTEASHVPVCSTAVPRSVCLRPRRGCSSPGIVRRSTPSPFWATASRRRSSSKAPRKCSMSTQTVGMTTPSLRACRSSSRREAKWKSPLPRSSIAS